MFVCVTAEFEPGTIPTWAVDGIVDRLPGSVVDTGPSGDVVVYTIEESGVREATWVAMVAIVGTVQSVCRYRRGNDHEPRAITAAVSELAPIRVDA